MISVAMATYNGEKYIAEQIYSILNQTEQIDEIIICDDGSKDRTIDIIRSIKDSRIQIYQNEINLGYIQNFTKAISKTKGEYIFLSDQDDIWERDKVEKIISVMKSEDCSAICTNFELINGDGKRIENRSQYQIDPFINKVKKRLNKITMFRLLFGNVAQGATYCFTSRVRDAFLKLKNQTVIHDYQIMLIATNLGKVLFLNEQLIEYRLHGENSVGFRLKKREWIGKKKTPFHKPFMVEFLDELNHVCIVKHLMLFKLIYYLRIPFIRAILRKAIMGK